MANPPNQSVLVELALKNAKASAALVRSLPTPQVVTPPVVTGGRSVSPGGPAPAFEGQ